jgi:hypothetical protein
MAVNAAARGVMTSAGLSFVRTYLPESDEPIAGAEVEYELTAAGWRARLR